MFNFMRRYQRFCAVCLLVL